MSIIVCFVVLHLESYTIFENNGSLSCRCVDLTQVPNSYVPWMSQHSCTYFVLFVFISLFYSQSKFWRFMWFSTVVWLESSSEPSKPCCSRWATTSPPGRTESHLPVRKLLPVCHGASEHTGLSESKGHLLLNEQTLAQKRGKIKKNKKKTKAANQNIQPTVAQVVKAYPLSYHLWPPRCFINKPTVAFSPNLLIRSLFQSHRVRLVPAGSSSVVILHTRSAPASAFLMRCLLFWKLARDKGAHGGLLHMWRDYVSPCVCTHTSAWLPWRRPAGTDLAKLSMCKILWAVCVWTQNGGFFF